MDDPRYLRERFDAIGQEIAALRLDCAAVRNEWAGARDDDEWRGLLDLLHAITREMRALSDEAREIMIRLRMMPG